MKIKKEKLFYLIPAGFLIVGIILLLGGIIWTVSSIEFKKGAVEISGEITLIEREWDSDGEIQHHVFVTYEYDGEHYKNIPIHSYSSDMYEGKEILLYCDSDFPEKVRAGSSLFIGSFILILIGTIFVLIGGGLLFPIMRKSKRKKKLMEQGRTIYAVVSEIIYDTRLTVNGRHPYRIICEYRDEYKDVTYRFKSSALWTDPNPVFPVGSTIDVLVDAEDYSTYYVKTEKMDQKIIDYT